MKTKKTVLFTCFISGVKSQNLYGKIVSIRFTLKVIRGQHNANNLKLLSLSVGSRPLRTYDRESFY